MHTCVFFFSKKQLNKSHLLVFPLPACASWSCPLPANPEYSGEGRWKETNHPIGSSTTAFEEQIAISEAGWFKRKRDSAHCRKWIEVRVVRPSPRAVQLNRDVFLWLKSIATLNTISLSVNNRVRGHVASFRGRIPSVPGRLLTISGQPLAEAEILLLVMRAKLTWSLKVWIN